MCAAWANDSGGGKTRVSCRTLSMSAIQSAIHDLLQNHLDRSAFRMPLELRPALHDQHPERKPAPGTGAELAEGDRHLEHRTHRHPRAGPGRPPAIVRPRLADE